MKRVIGDTGLPISNTLTPVGSPPVQLLSGLSNTSITMMFVNRKDNTSHVGTGISTIVDANKGVFVYTFSEFDLSVAGLFDIYPILQTPNGPAHYISQLLEIKDIP